MKSIMVERLRLILSTKSINMKEFIYIYLIIGCYIAHRRTSKRDVNSKEFLISYVKTVVTYPIEILRELSNKKNSKGEM